MKLIIFFLLLALPIFAKVDPDDVYKVDKKRSIHLFMNKDQVLKILGNPSKINKNEDSEEWIYICKDLRLYFVYDRLDMIDRPRQTKVIY